MVQGCGTGVWYRGEVQGCGTGVKYRGVVQGCGASRKTRVTGVWCKQGDKGNRGVVQAGRQG